MAIKLDFGIFKAVRIDFWLIFEAKLDIDC